MGYLFYFAALALTYFTDELGAFAVFLVVGFFLMVSKLRSPKTSQKQEDVLPFEDRELTRDDFSDVNLYRSLAAYNEGGPVRLSDFYERDRLTLRESNIKSLAGLEVFAPLGTIEDVDIKRNNITDLWPLTNLPNLKKLDIYLNGLSDLAPLAGLGKLEELYMENNKIMDIGPLSELENLRELNITTNKIKDLYILGGLTSLKMLFVGGNPVTDLGPIASLTGLKHLSVNRMELTDLSFLANLRELESLDIRDNRISDISVLRGLENLKEVLLGNNCIKDMSPADHVMELEGQGDQRVDCNEDDDW